MMVVLCLVVFLGLAIARLLAARAAGTARIIVIAGACGLVADGFTTIRAADVPPSLPAGVSVSRGDVHVVVSSEKADLRAMVERQPDSRLESALGMALLYRVPSCPVAPQPTTPSGVRLPLTALTSQCSPERIALLTDGDVGTGWGCGIRSRDQSLTADVGGPSQSGAIVHALGPPGCIFRASCALKRRSMAWPGPRRGREVPPPKCCMRRRPRRETRMVIECPPRSARYVRMSQLGCEGDYGCLEVWSGPRSR